RELADFREKQATVYAAMTYEQNETIRAMHHAELEKLVQTVAQLEKRASKAQSNVQSAQAKQDGHKRLVEHVKAAIARHDAGDPEETARWREALAPITSDPTAPDRILPAILDVVDEVSLDKLSREEKRDIMRDLDVQVPMYPVHSEWARTHEHRWGFRFTGDVLSGVSS
ncbi:MAG TPA: hypothetical protein VGS80_14675, partial [Ktedonobacterales bacterium]|nr:hypothetical protein [Ktedonobacterales bacterium]